MFLIPDPKTIGDFSSLNNYRTEPMVEFSMTKHSADPNQTYLARIRKLIHFTVRIQKNAKKQMQKSKEFFLTNRSVFRLKLATPKQIHILQSFYGTRIRKISTRIRKILTRIRNYFIQTCGSEVPHWYKT